MSCEWCRSSRESTSSIEAPRSQDQGEHDLFLGVVSCRGGQANEREDGDTCSCIGRFWEPLRDLFVMALFEKQHLRSRIILSGDRLSLLCITRRGGSLAGKEVAPSALAMPFKYAAKFPKECECPPEACVPTTGILFRVAFNPLDERSFVPRAANDATVAHLCEGWGLSLWTTKDKVVKKFANVLKNHPQVGKRIGDHIAVGTLADTHGVMSPAAATGHVTVHEFADVTLSAVFKLDCPINPPAPPAKDAS